MSEYHLHILFCKDYGKENEIMGVVMVLQSLCTAD